MKRSFTGLLQTILFAGMMLLTKEATATTYTFQTAGPWQTAANWSNSTPAPTTLPAGDEIIINAACTYSAGFGQPLSPTFVGTVTINSSLLLSKVTNGGGSISVQGSLNIGAGASLTVSGLLSFTITGSAGNVTNYGTLSVSRVFSQEAALNNYGTVNLTDTSLFTQTSSGITNNYGSFNILSGFSPTIAGSFINQSGATFTNSLDPLNISGSMTNDGTITNNVNGRIYLNGSATLTNNGTFTNNATFTNNGTLRGIGTFNGSFTNPSGGTVAPGASLGCMTFNNGLTNNGTLSMEINGTAPCTGYDRISVTGTATIGGSGLTLIFGYAAITNTSFDILTAGSVSGTFGGNVSFSNTGAGNVTAISVNYPGGNTVRVTVSSPLAVELVGFSAKKEGGHVRLDWETASETNNRGFEIQRSGNGTDWKSIGFENGNGTTTARHDYSFLDEKPLAGQSFYRLRQMDFDGKEDFSGIETVEMAGSGHGFSVFPNPVSDGELTILFDEKMEGEISQIRLFNATGQLVKSIGLSHTMDVDGLPMGIYSLEMGGFFQKIIVQ